MYDAAKPRVRTKTETPETGAQSTHLVGAVAAAQMRLQSCRLGQALVLDIHVALKDHLVDRHLLAHG